MNKKILVSIVIVHFNAHKEIINLLESIKLSTFKHYEIIIVDNDTNKPLNKKILNKFLPITYIKNHINNGYGGGNNIGARRARGEYLLFLNPDTIINSNVIKLLVEFLEKHKKCGIVAPLLLHPNKTPYTIQGSRALTPLTAIVCFSFINKYFPRNFISQNYFLYDWNKNDPISVDAVPGSAFMIRKSSFNAVNGFDEQMYLYFEEHDLGKRIIEKGYSIYFYPIARVVHVGEVGTRNIDTRKIFTKSRHYYFKKHFGWIYAALVEAFLIQ